MFTGIVECTSAVLEAKKRDGGLVFTIEKPADWELCDGQSVAVSGVCLTVESYTDKDFTLTLVPETLEKTSFGSHTPNEVNLERAMEANGRFDGHLMQGHVDCIGTVESFSHHGLEVVLTVMFPKEHTELVVQKGSIAINGVSLTVTDCKNGELTVVLIPHTLEVTTLNQLKEGDVVNLEFDIIGKYIRNGNK